RVARAGRATGADRVEAVAPVDAGRGAAEAGEVGVEREVAAVVEGARVAAGGVRLPELDQRVRDGRAVAVVDEARDLDRLAGDGAARRRPPQKEVAVRDQVSPRADIRAADQVGAALPR